MTHSVVVERDFPHPPAKLWRALTQPQLMADWLMKTDFRPEVGHLFTLTGDWGGVLDCKVLVVAPERVLSYTWTFAHDDPAFAVDTVVTFTLTPTPAGTRLQVEQVGFRAEQRQALGGARMGWDAMLGKLDTVLNGLA